MFILWKLAVVEVLVQASRFGKEEEDPEVWGPDGPWCLVRGSQRGNPSEPGLMVRWGTTPWPLRDGASPCGGVGSHWSLVTTTG